MPASERATADLVMLMITGTIALSILLTGGGIFLVAALHPELDALSQAFAVFGDVIGLLIGSVLGYLAGRGRSPTSKETI